MVAYAHLLWAVLTILGLGSIFCVLCVAYHFFSVRVKFCVLLLYVYVCVAWEDHPQNCLLCVKWDFKFLLIHLLFAFITSVVADSCMRLTVLCVVGSSVHEVYGPRLFTTAGHAYRHLFNISLCGPRGTGQLPQLAVCSDNMTSSTSEQTTSDHNSDNTVSQFTIIFFCLAFTLVTCVTISPGKS